MVFILGQELYPGARFPSLDFSLVHLLDENGDFVDILIDKRGRRAKPERRISAAVKRKIDIPEHLETRFGRIEDFPA